MDHGGGLRSRQSHSAPSAWAPPPQGAASPRDPYAAPMASNPYGGFGGGVSDNSHLREVGGLGYGGGAGFGSGDPFGGGGDFGGDPAAGFSAYDSGRGKGGSPWKKILIIVVFAVVVLCGIYYFFLGAGDVRVATPAKEDSTVRAAVPDPGMQQNGATNEEEAPPPDEPEESPANENDEWRESEHTRSENIGHEEMKGDDGKQLSNDLKGLAKKAKMFFELDQNKDAFLAGADVPKGTVDLLDTNDDMALSFGEWTHGFSHVEDDRKLEVFKTFYGQAYGNVLPHQWTDRVHFTGEELPEDDRHLDHPMDAEAKVVGSGSDALDMDPGEMTDEELNAALDKDFTKMDSDGDGVVTLEEYKQWDVGNADVESDYNVLDRNHDGKLTRVELSGSDDHSSYISHEEHEKQHNELHEKHVKNKQEAMEKAQALGTDVDEAARHADEEADDADDDEELEESQLLAEFERMDTDNDGHVSEDEYVIWAEQANPGDTSARHNFRLIDRNKSKKLTFRELFPTSIRKRDVHYHEEEKKTEPEPEGSSGNDASSEAAASPEDEEEQLVQGKFGAADTNSDGRLSASEADAIGLRDDEGSVKADTNKDGYVDIEEFRAQHATSRL